MIVRVGGHESSIPSHLVCLCVEFMHVCVECMHVCGHAWCIWCVCIRACVSHAYVCPPLLPWVGVGELCTDYQH